MPHIRANGVHKQQKNYAAVLTPFILRVERGELWEEFKSYI